MLIPMVIWDVWNLDTVRLSFIHSNASQERGKEVSVTAPSHTGKSWLCILELRETLRSSVPEKSKVL